MKMGIHGYCPGAFIYVTIWLVLSRCLVCSDLDYQSALTKSTMFFEAQRSGKLPPNNRISWRGDSGLQDGKLENVDLVGGYYDAGDNVKYGLPMAFTVTTLAWSAIAYQSDLQAAGEMKNVEDAIRWGTDYLVKASARRHQLYVQVGDACETSKIKASLPHREVQVFDIALPVLYPLITSLGLPNAHVFSVIHKLKKLVNLGLPNAPVKDHQCWIRPENMKTPRTLLKVDRNTPGTEIAAETSAALAAASLVFKGVDRAYAGRLLNRAKTLFNFAKTYKGTYDGECPFYCSNSGYNDELLWAATWLYAATKRSIYMDYIKEEAISGTVCEFSWDLKYAGAQILLSEYYMDGQKDLQSFKQEADSFVCSILPDSPDHQVYISPGGLIHLRDGANSQYVTSTAFLFSVYSDFLRKHKQQVICSSKKFSSSHLMGFAKQQMDYLLGKNPQGRSYMVGFGNKAPAQAHHRGASVPQMPPDKMVNCAMTFVHWYNTNASNPHELTGAIVGGPDKNDSFFDQRTNSAMTEPTTYINSLAVGVLAKLAKHHAQI